MQLMEIAINEAVTGIIGIVVAGVVGFLAGTVRRMSKVERARIIIEKASARSHILHAFERYVVNGEHMTIARYDELNEEYEAYLVLGGNGTAKRYMEEIRKLKPYLVTD